MTGDNRDRGVRFQLLGPFRAWVGETEVPADAWPGRRATELVQLLALSDEHRLSRDEAIEALWQTLDATAGAANLRKAAHHARQALASSEAVVLRSGQVRLFPGERIATDLTEFESQAEAALAGGDEAECLAASASYAGELLPDSIYEDWTQAPRERVRSLACELLRRAGAWERLVALDPIDEPAYRELMRAQLADGRRPAAIRWYGRLKHALRRELGMAPGPETVAVYNDCVAGLGIGEETLVGRELELAKLKGLLRADPTESPATVVIRGPAGIGKSALCRELGREAREAGWAVVRTTATEAGMPYGPLGDAVAQLTGGPDGHENSLGERGRLVLAGLESGEAPPGTILTRHQVIGAIRRLLLSAAGEGRVAFILDDAHLADEATIDVVGHLGAVAVDRLLVILSYRAEAAPESLRRAVARLSRAGKDLEVDLEPLEPEDSAALVVANSSVDRPPDAVSRIVELGQGNPFLTQELARSAVAGVPALVATARDAIASRFADFDEASSAVLSRLALAGDEIDPGVASALVGRPEAEAFALIDQALGAGILIVDGESYRFRHDIVRTVLADRLAPHERIAAHREMAKLLADAAAPPGIVAMHLLEGNSAEEAGEWLLEAARQASTLGAYADAIGYLDRLLEFDAENPEALAIRAESLDARGERSAPEAYARAAVAGGPEADDLLAKRGLALVKLGDPPAGLAGLEDLKPVTLMGRISHALAFAGAAALGFGDPRVGSERAGAARRLAIESGDPDAVAVASWANAAAAHANGELRESVETDLRDTYNLSKLAVSVFDGQLCITQRLLYGARPYPDVIGFADAFVEEAERLGAARGVAFGVTIRGEAKLLAGDLDAADADLEAGVRLHREIDAATGEAFATQRRAEVAFRLGRRQDALELLDEALVIARESDVGFHLLDRIYGTLIELAPDPDAGLAALEEAEAGVRGPVETCPGCRITLAVPAAIAAARAGDLSRLDEWEHQAEYLANVVMRLPAWDAALLEVRGSRARFEGDQGRARELFDAAAKGFAKAGQPLDEARCAELALAAA